MSTPAPLPAEAESEPPSILPHMIGLGLTLVLLALVLRAGFQSIWRGQVEGTLAELSTQGLGVDDLYSERPTPNGALDLHKAADQIQRALNDDLKYMSGTRPSLLAEVLASPASENSGIVYSRTSSSSPKDLKAALATFVKAVDGAQADLDRGLSRGIVYPTQWERGFEAEMPWLMETKDLVGSLKVRAGQRMVRKDGPGAYADLLRCLRLAATLDDASTITRLVQIALAESCVVVLEDLLSAGLLPPTELRGEIVRYLEGLAEISAMTKVLRGELYAFSVMPDDPTILGSGEEGMAGSSLLWGYWRTKHVELMADLIRASCKPADEFDAYLETFETVTIVDANPISRILLPALTKILTKERKVRTRLRLARWGLKLAGQDPLPAEAGAAPKDPFTLDTLPCRYKREGRGALLWGIGEDRLDSGGSSDPQGYGPDDLTFRLLRK